MALSLSRGQNTALTKGHSGLSKLIVGLGWSVNLHNGQDDFDLDASAMLFGANGKIARPGDVVFYDNLKHYSGAVEHMGDNLNGGCGEDDEQIKIDLARLPVGVAKIVITVTIYEAEKRGQNFGQISNAFVRIIDEDSGMELIRYDLENDFSNDTAVLVCEIYRSKVDWYFKAIGAGRR